MLLLSLYSTQAHSIKTNSIIFYIIFFYCFYLIFQFLQTYFSIFPLYFVLLLTNFPILANYSCTEFLLHFLNKYILSALHCHFTLLSLQFYLPFTYSNCRCGLLFTFIPLFSQISFILSTFYLLSTTQTLHFYPDIIQSPIQFLFLSSVRS